jgi:hypothetical protein
LTRRSGETQNVTDSGETARTSAGLFACLGVACLSLAEERLEWTRRARLTGREGADLEKARFAVAWEWTRRLVDLLEEDPRVEADLRAVGSRSGQRCLPTP